MKHNEKAPSNLAELSTIEGWAKLQESEQSFITTETTAIATALHGVSQAKIAVGEHLSRVREILEPKRIFTKYLKTMFHLSKATAYRYIDLYDAAKTSLPAPVLQIAMMRPDDRLTIKAIKNAPKPPRTTNIVKINEYLDSLQHRKAAAVVSNERKMPDDVRKSMFHSLCLMLKKIHGKQKLVVLSEVVGMVLSELGTPTLSITAKAAPESFRTTRGRPRKAA